METLRRIILHVSGFESSVQLDIASDHVHVLTCQHLPVVLSVPVCKQDPGFCCVAKIT